jgi:hypothetical protein
MFGVFRLKLEFAKALIKCLRFWPSGLKKKRDRLSKNGSFFHILVVHLKKTGQIVEVYEFSSQMGFPEYE